MLQKNPKKVYPFRRYPKKRFLIEYPPLSIFWIFLEKKFFFSKKSEKISEHRGRLPTSSEVGVVEKKRVFPVFFGFFQKNFFFKKSSENVQKRVLTCPKEGVAPILDFFGFIRKIGFFSITVERLDRSLPNFQDIFS